MRYMNSRFTYLLTLLTQLRRQHDLVVKFDDILSTSTGRQCGRDLDVYILGIRTVNGEVDPRSVDSSFICAFQSHD